MGTERKPKRSRSDKAGIIFPVARIERYLRQRNKRLSLGAAVYLAAVLEYLCAEVVEIAGCVAKQNQKQRITPRHIQLAVKNDEDFDVLLKQVTLANAGVVPNINATLLPKKSA